MSSENDTLESSAMSGVYTSNEGSGQESSADDRPDVGAEYHNKYHNLIAGTRPDLGAEYHHIMTGSFLPRQVNPGDYSSSDVASTTDTEGNAFYLQGDEDVFSKVVRKEEKKIASQYGLRDNNEDDSLDSSTYPDDNKALLDNAFLGQTSMDSRSIFADSYDGILQRFEDQDERRNYDTPGKQTAATASPEDGSFFDEDISITLPGPTVDLSPREVDVSSPARPRTSRSGVVCDKLRAMRLVTIIIILLIVMLMAIGVAIASWAVEKNQNSSEAAALNGRPRAPSSFIPDTPTVSPQTNRGQGGDGAVEPTPEPGQGGDGVGDATPEPGKIAVGIGEPTPEPTIYLGGCDTDSEEVFFISDRFGEQNCEWLATRPAQRNRMCQPQHDGFRYCPKTCNRCDATSQAPSAVFSSVAPVVNSTGKPTGGEKDNVTSPTFAPSTATPTTLDQTSTPTLLSTTKPTKPPTSSPVVPTTPPTTKPTSSPTSSPVVATASPSRIPPSSLRPTSRPTVIESPTTEPPVSTEAPSARRECGEDTDEFFYVSDAFGEQNCEWLQTRPAQRRRMCQPQHAGYTLCRRTCGNCSPTTAPVSPPNAPPTSAPTVSTEAPPSLRPTSRPTIASPTTEPPVSTEAPSARRECGKDSDEFFFISDTFGEQNCEWLQTRPAQRSRLCQPQNAGYELCRRTCGNCSPTTAPVITPDAPPTSAPVVSTPVPVVSTLSPTKATFTMTPSVAATTIRPTSDPTVADTPAPTPPEVPCGEDAPNAITFVNEIIGGRTCEAIARLDSILQRNRFCQPGRVGWVFCKATCGNTCAPTVSEQETPAPSLSTDSPTLQSTKTSTVRDAIVDALPGSTRNLDNGSTPQGKGLQWLLGNDDIESMSEWKMVQRWAIASLGYSLEYETSNTQSRWFSKSVSECRWSGVDCDRNGRVNSIQLRASNLEGELLPELSVLADTLITLDLADNDIEGGLPSEYGLLTQLMYLDLETNDLEGPLPVEVGNMENLLEMNLSFNLFSGVLPSSLANIRTLERLYIYDNDFTGGVTSRLCSRVEVLEADCRELSCDCCTQCWFQCGGRHPPC